MSQQGNTRLVEYGIQTEQSDWRAHVCFLTKRVYAFQTKDGIATVNTHQYAERKVWTDNIVTATGYLVPPEDIEGIRRLQVPKVVLETHDPGRKSNTSTKGQAAVNVVQWTLKTGRFPIVLFGKEQLDWQMQIEGTDIYVQGTTKLKIQVKCDYNGGPKDLGGTGNLFLQTKECNPFKRF